MARECLSVKICHFHLKGSQLKVKRITVICSTVTHETCVCKFNIEVCLVTIVVVEGQ